MLGADYSINPHFAGQIFDFELQCSHMIYIGADHGGFKLKVKIKKWLTEWKLEYEDVGAHKLDPEDDYPQFAFAVAEKVADDDDMNAEWAKRPKGILLCRSAGGMIIAANKIKDIRAVAVANETQAKHAREHNDSNVIGISGDWTTEDDAKKIIKIWLDTEFSGEDRHDRRVQQIRQKEYMGKGCCGGSC